MQEYLVLIAALATLLATFVYVRSMFKGPVKPNRISWLMWAIAPFIATAASVSNGVGWAVLPVFMSGFSPFLIFMVSFFTKKDSWRLSRFDYACGALSGMALVLWYLTKEPDVAIIFAIASDGLAAVPTITKAWSYPETESGLPYAVGVFNSLSSFGAMTLWSFSEYAFPAYLVLINLMLASLAYRKKLTFLKH